MPRGVLLLEFLGSVDKKKGEKDMRDLIHVGQDGKLLYVSESLKANHPRLARDGDIQFIWDLYPTLDRARLSEELSQLGRSCQIFELEDGLPQVLEAQALSKDQREGGFIALVSKAVDSTEPWVGNELEAIGKVTGRIGHDFNNLFGSIRGCIDLIKMRTAKYFEGENPLERQLRIIDSAIDKGVQITSRLRGFVRPELMQKSLMRIDECVGSVVALFQQSHSFPVEIIFVSETDREIEASEFAVGQIVTNLCLNAVDAMSEISERVLVVMVSDIELEEGDFRELKPGSYVRVSVIDHGRGIDPKNLSRVAKPFFTTKPATTGNGFGLSLAMAKEIMNRHDGLLSIVSERECGTAVNLYFPATLAQL